MLPRSAAIAREYHKRYLLSVQPNAKAPKANPPTVSGMVITMKGGPRKETSPSPSTIAGISTRQIAPSNRSHQRARLTAQNHEQDRQTHQHRPECADHPNVRRRVLDQARNESSENHQGQQEQWNPHPPRLHGIGDGFLWLRFRMCSGSVHDCFSKSGSYYFSRPSGLRPRCKWEGSKPECSKNTRVPSPSGSSREVYLRILNRSTVRP